MTTSSRDSSKASCAASCRSCSGRDVSRGRTGPHKTAASRHGRTLGRQARQRAQATATLERTEGDREREGPGGSRPETGSGSRRVGRAARGQLIGPACAPFPNFQGDAGVQPQMHDLSQDKKLRLRAMDVPRERKTLKRVLVGPHGRSK